MWKFCVAKPKKRPEFNIKQSKIIIIKIISIFLIEPAVVVAVAIACGNDAT